MKSTVSPATLQRASPASATPAEGGGGAVRPPSPSTAASTDLLARSWTAASSGYDELFVPRFGPWTEDALTVLRRSLEEDANDDGGGGVSEPRKDRRQQPPGGNRALVACCGPGQELLPVSDIMGPGSEVTGIDISPGMIRVARCRIAAGSSTEESERRGGEIITGAECAARIADAASSVDARVGDAMRPPPGPYRAIFSAFGLQQLPDPIEALTTWLEELCPGGVAVVVYWPPGKVEERGPWARWGDLLRQKGNLPPPRQDGVWDDVIVDTLKAAGAEMLEDRFVTHVISWNNPTQFWNGMTRSGPWQAARLKRSDEFVDGLREEFCSAFEPSEPLVHSPTARMLAFRRTRAAPSTAS